MQITSFYTFIYSTTAEVGIVFTISNLTKYFEQQQYELRLQETYERRLKKQ